MSRNYRDPLLLEIKEKRREEDSGGRRTLSSSCSRVKEMGANRGEVWRGKTTLERKDMVQVVMVSKGKANC